MKEVVIQYTLEFSEDTSNEDVQDYLCVMELPLNTKENSFEVIKYNYEDPYSI